jgi:hypothetical protein
VAVTADIPTENSCTELLFQARSLLSDMNFLFAYLDENELRRWTRLHTAIGAFLHAEIDKTALLGGDEE